ncbi:MAG: AAA family ATPase [Myxococcales bacterium]|nr:AAA family ATPase [Myxococcales bacterium]
MKSLTFFNHKGGVGKTTLTAHVAHMLAQLGVRVVVLDYDPQCNVSLALLGVRRLSEIQEAAEEEGRTVAACLSDQGGLGHAGPQLFCAQGLGHEAGRLRCKDGHPRRNRPALPGPGAAVSQLGRLGAVQFQAHVRADAGRRCVWEPEL